jgi:hypothetical protein
MTEEQTLKLKNGQYIQVNIRGEWIDALFVKYNPRIHYFHGAIYAHYMGIDRITQTASSIYGIGAYFDLDEVKIPKGSDKK